MQPVTFRISSLIRITLLLLYFALTVPLPFLAEFTHSSISPNLLWGGLSLGAIALYAALSERVILDEEQIQVSYPQWVPKLFRSGWSLSWSEIKDLKLRTTGQGGIVYYFLTHTQEKAYLLPMRVAGFNRLVNIVQEKTGIDTKEVRPLSQSWMYLTLLLFTLFLLLIDGWTIWNAISL